MEVGTKPIESVIASRVSNVVEKLGQEQEQDNFPATPHHVPEPDHRYLLCSEEAGTSTRLVI